MTEQDAPIFIGRLLAIAEVYNRELSAPAQMLYFDALKEFPLTDVLNALEQAINGKLYFPVPAIIRELLIGSEEDQVETAWQEWKLAARRHGSYVSLVLHDSALAETLVAVFGGWPQACSAELSDEMWSAKRKEFSRVYRVMVKRELSGPRRLAGLAEIQNTNPEWEHHTPIAHIGTADRKQLT